MGGKVLHVNTAGFGEFKPFHERYKTLLITCSLAGLHLRATDRILSSRWQRILLRIWTTIIHIILTSIFMSSFIHIFISIANKEEVARTIASIVIMGCSVHGVFRQYYMHKNIDKYDRFYQKWDELFGENDPDWKTREVFINRQHRTLRKTLLTVGGITCVLLTAFPIINMFSPDKVFTLPTAIPYKHQSPDFEIFMSYYTFGIFFHTIAVSSSQMLLLTPIVWELGELYRLQARFKEILIESQSFKTDVTTNNGFRVKANTYTANGISSIETQMKMWIKQHQKLAKFHVLSMELNNFELGMQMIATFVECCSMAIISATPNYMPASDKICSIPAFIAYFSLFFYSCSKCKELSDLSVHVADSAYEENWSAMPLTLNKNFHIILSRAMKPFNFYGAYIFCIDITTFNNIFQTGYTVFNFYFTIMNT